jgi:hypothetical protein
MIKMSKRININESANVEILISKAPDDSEERKKWAYQLMRIQVAMWVDGISKCNQCGHIYTTVDDFLERNPRSGGFDKNDKLIFVDDKCFEEWSKNHEV